MGNVIHTLRQIPNCLLGKEDGLASTKLELAAAYVHEDLIAEILSRLPIKSVLRFKCVCKTWQTIIVSSAFTKKHFVNYSSRQKKKLLTYSCPRTKEEEQFVYALPPTSDGDRLNLPFRPPYTAPIHVRGSSNGIVCLSQYTHESGQIFTLWNPATREYRLVPRAPVPLRNIGGCMSVAFAFLGRDYKLMSLRSKRENDCMYVDTFSLTRNCWESGIKMLKYSVVEMSFTCLTANGYLHWMGKKNMEGGGREVILVSFDMREETFAEPTRMPCVADTRIYKLDVFKESQLVLFAFPSARRSLMGETIEIWLINYRGNPNWTKHSILKLPSSINIGWPIRFWEEEEEIIFTPLAESVAKTTWKSTFLYNPRNGSFRNIPSNIPSIQGTLSTRFFPHLDTLLSVNGD